MSLHADVCACVVSQCVPLLSVQYDQLKSDVTFPQDVKLQEMGVMSEGL